jgi:ABC-type oligopeptide transport system substrate-binding subunit
MRRSFRRSSLLLLIGLPALLLACGNSTGPWAPPLGNYIAKVWFTTPQGGSQRDELAAGSTLTLNLTLDGLTSGHLHLAAFGTNPVVDADMAGTWSLNGKDVTFTQTADTFVRNMTFTIYQFDDKHWYLAGNQVISGTRFNLGLWPP